MNLIACVDSNWAISNKGEILVSIPADKKLFKELTDGKVVVGDRRTMDISVDAAIRIQFMYAVCTCTIRTLHTDSELYFEKIGAVCDYGDLHYSD